MERGLAELTTPAAAFGFCVAVLWGPATGYPTWPALARGRLGSTVAVSLAVGFLVFTFARRLAAPAAG
jgi:hypothetical protein